MIVLRSGCKINLFLDITGLRPDGKHELYSLFWPLSDPHDELLIRPAPSGFSLRCKGHSEIDPAHNTLSKAWQAFADATGFRPGLDLELCKGVPSGAGLGGGSADAAALLLWLNSQVPQPLLPEALSHVAVSVGADVPFFLHNRPALATGIGESLVDFAEAELFRGLWLVLLCPHIAVSTAWAFRAWDAENTALGTNYASGASHVLTNAAWQSSTPKSRLTVAQHVRNSLEMVVFAAHPRIAACKASLFEHKASAAGMSGSGAAVFGLFREGNHAHKAAQALAHEQAGSSVQVWVQML